MRLQEALKYFPPSGTPLEMMAEPAKVHAAGQAVAEDFRKLFGEQIMFFRRFRRLMKHAKLNSDFALVRMEDLAEIEKLEQELYRHGLFDDPQARSLLARLPITNI